MNKRNVLAVAAAIEKHSIKRLGFNMGRYFGKASNVGKDMSGHRCGTVACIAGWAYAVKHGSKLPKNAVGDVEYAAYSEAVKFFGLNDSLSDTWELFHPSRPWATITPKDAVKVLRNLAKTGKVDWSVADA